jgi:large subunit ribosomal protein L22
MKIEASLNNLRISPRKIRLVTDMIKGQDIDDAQVQLEHTVKKSSPVILKLLKSAVANAENNFGMDRSNLYVYDVQVGEGTKLKRWLPRAYGRATLILKRASNIYLTLAERVEGKNRKTKEQMEKDRKSREEAKKKLEKEIKEEREKTVSATGKASEDKTEKIFKEKKEEAQNKGGKKGWMKKMFQRKAG